LSVHNELLSKLNRQKTEFVQDMSHEMKAPLTVIAAGIDFADRQMKKESGSLHEAGEALDNIRNETQRLGRMVSGMVSLAHMNEVGTRARTNFSALIKNSAEAFRSSVEQRGNGFKVEIAPNMPETYIEGDRFTQVIVNLLSNASEHTENGSVTLTANFDGKYITVCVTDNGKGIEPELLPRVFERGVSGRDSTGYGLYISKVVVEAHGGEINIESPVAWARSSASAARPAEPGKGTAVKFSVPVYGGQEAGHNI